MTSRPSCTALLLVNVPCQIPGRPVGSMPMLTTNMSPPCSMIVAGDNFRGRYLARAWRVLDRRRHQTNVETCRNSGQPQGRDCLIDGKIQCAVRQLADLTLDEARAAIADLRPPVLDDLGMADGLTQLGPFGRAARYLGGRRRMPVPEHAEIALYRIAQQTLQNVVKHARADRVQVDLPRDGGHAFLRVPNSPARPG